MTNKEFEEGMQLLHTTIMPYAERYTCTKSPHDNKTLSAIYIIDKGFHLNIEIFLGDDMVFNSYAAHYTDEEKDYNEMIYTNNLDKFNKYILDKFLLLKEGEIL